MEVHRRESSSSLVLDIAGEVDLYNAHILKDQLSNLAAEKSSAPVVIDLGRVDYIDSSGIGSLISGKGALEKAGRRLGLCNLTGSVRSIMRMTKLLSFFQIFDSEEDALRSLRGASAPAVGGQS